VTSPLIHSDGAVKRCLTLPHSQINSRSQLSSKQNGRSHRIQKAAFGCIAKISAADALNIIP